MALILAVVRPFGAPPLGSTAAAAAPGPRSPTGSGRRKDSGSADGTGGPGKGHQGPGSLAIAVAAAGMGSGLGESLFETLLVADGELAQVVVGCAVDGLCWPDTESAHKAIAACRWALCDLDCGSDGEVVQVAAEGDSTSQQITDCHALVGGFALG
eukprot:1161186-Pelagomonas_calceolata.AAC.18